MQGQFKHHPDLFEPTQKFESRRHVEYIWQLLNIELYKEDAVYDIWDQSENDEYVEAKERVNDSAFAASDDKLDEVMHCYTRGEKEKADDEVREEGIGPDLSLCPTTGFHGLSQLWKYWHYIIN